MTWRRWESHQHHRRTPWGWVTVDVSREPGSTSWVMWAEAVLGDGTVLRKEYQGLEGARPAVMRDFAEAFAERVEAHVTAARGGA